MISSFVLISLLSLMLFSTIFTGVQINNDFSDSYFINDYLYKQSEALKSHELINLDYGLYFNGDAHINQARTLIVNGKYIVVTLGNGRIHYE